MRRTRKSLIESVIRELVHEERTRIKIKELLRPVVHEQMRQIFEASDYKTFFKDTLKQFSEKFGKEVNSPADMTDDEKKEFFNYIESNWKNEKSD